MESFVRLIVSAGLALAISACSTIIEGTSQDITVGTIPPEAACDLERDGAIIAQIATTPESATVEKNKQNILITCRKAGFMDGTYSNKSDFAGATAGNLLLGGVIGIGIDAATGAANKYESNVMITLEPEGGTPSTAPADQTPSSTGVSTLKPAS